MNYWFLILIMFLINLNCFANTPAYPKDLKINENELKEWINSNIFEEIQIPYFIYDIKGLSSDERLNFVKEFLKWIKFYIESDEFKNKFHEQSLTFKPDPLSVNPYVSAEDRLKEVDNQIKDIEKQLLDKSIGPFAREGLSMSLEQNKSNFQSIKDDPESYEENEKNRFNEENAAYEEKMKIYEKMSNYQDFIRNNLNELLDILNSIDFDAEINIVNNVKYFKNAEYQIKSNQWKLFFRAGKEIVNEMKIFIGEWIKEL